MIEGLFQPTHLIIILLIVLVVFGPGKLANAGGAMGKSIKEFKEQFSAPGSSPEARPAQISAVAAAGSASSDLHQKVAASDPSHV